MKAITVQDQVRLGPRRCLALTLSGMSYRLFRSMVTVVILALAVAFLAHMLAYSLISHRSQIGAWEELEDHRALGAWVTRLARVDPAGTVLEGLAEHPERRAEYRAWALAEGADPETFETMVEVAGDLVALWRWFEGLSEDERIVLLPAADVRVGVRRLAAPETFELFERRLGDVRRQPPLGSVQQVRTLLTERLPALDALVAKVRDGHRRAIEEVKSRFDHPDPQQWFARDSGKLAEVAAEAGFRADAGRLGRLATRARLAMDHRRVARLLAEPGLEQVLRRDADYEMDTFNLGAVNRWLTRRDRAEAFYEAVGAPEGLDPDRLLELAFDSRREQVLRRAVGDRPPRTEAGMFGLPVRMQWLLLVSFLVCVVGVANAMFMAVTERFAEIATMKCLGALDGFVMMMFFFESVIQGLIGAAGGVVVGYLLAFVRGGGDYGSLMFESLPAGPLAIGAGLSVMIGILLATFAAIGPAWLAARLAPMEAMRIE